MQGLFMQIVLGQLTQDALIVGKVWLKILWVIPFIRAVTPITTETYHRKLTVDVQYETISILTEIQN